MQIVFYGTRGSFPTTEQMISTLLSTPEGDILIDVGSATIFKEPKIVDNVLNVLISHNHNDHVAMLPHFLISRLYQQQNDKAELLRKCLIVAPEPITDILESMELKNDTFFSVTTKTPETILNMKLQSITTNHKRKNNCYKLQANNYTIVFTGDTSYHPELSKFCTGADLLICEASYANQSLEKANYWGHMTPDMVARLLNEAQPKMVILSHFVELSGKKFSEDVRTRINYPVEILYAFDGLKIMLNTSA